MDTPTGEQTQLSSDDTVVPAATVDPTAAHTLDHVQWYRSESRLGQVMLGIEVHEPVATVLQGLHQVLRQGTLLAEHELLIEALELWQELQLDPVPLPDLAEPVCDVECLAMVIRAPDVPMLGALHVRLPLTSLPDIKSAEQALPEQLSLTWSAIRCDLQLSSLHLAAVESSNLETGAVVLLPESYRDIWKVTVSVAEADINFTAGFSRADLTLSAFEAVQPSTQAASRNSVDGGSPLHVVLKTPVDLDAGKFLGFSLEGADLSSDWDQHGVDVYGDGRVKGTGDLVRLGSGYAVYLTAYGELQQDD
ncbi:MAG: hypothetical protein KTR33_16210 [Gammaproteobacteria bacterium]|nr:hypothetical protein [Gammaproteobacteria bacterium]